jgi:hypothetical protein
MTILERKLERMREIEQELERMHDLEDELQELREVEENNQRLREANEQLGLELDKRDQAINEAVELICQLEAKTEAFQAGRPASRASTPQLWSGDSHEAGPADVSTPKAQVIVDIPDRTSSKRGTAGLSHRSQKAPSFLREENRSTATLRSLYMADDNRSFRSFEMQSAAEFESPRLSILSECSYLSPYDPSLELGGVDRLDMSPNSTVAVKGPDDAMGESKIARIARWIQPREKIIRSTGPKTRGRASSDVSRGGHALSFDDGILPGETPRSPKPHPLEALHHHNHIFGGKLPPTPDTMSTSRPGAGNSSDPSILTDKPRQSRPSLDSPFTGRRRMGDRPRSAGDISARTSTAINGISDGLKTPFSDTTQGPPGASERSDEVGLFPSLDHFVRGSNVPGHGRQRRSLYGGNLTFSGEGAEGVVPGMAKSCPSSPRSTNSEPQSMWQSSPPPLSPQDWLEAALPARPNRRSKRDRTAKAAATEELHSKSSHPPGSRRPRPDRTLSGETALPRRESQHSDREAPQLPRPSILRLRSWGQNLEQIAVPPGRRRLSLRPRFFSRSGSNSQRVQQPLKSDPVDRSEAPSPVTPKSRNLIVTRQRRADSNPNSFSSSAIDIDEGNREPSHWALPRALAELRSSSQASKRPMTSDGADTKRRSSLGFLGWVKGASGFGSQSNKDPDASPASRSVATTEKEKAPRFSAQFVGAAGGRPNSARAVITAVAGTSHSRAETPGSPPKGKLSSSSAIEDEPDWRSRRRSRRIMAS